MGNWAGRRKRRRRDGRSDPHAHQGLRQVPPRAPQPDRPQRVRAHNVHRVHELHDHPPEVRAHPTLRDRRGVHRHVSPALVSTVC